MQKKYNILKYKKMQKKYNIYINFSIISAKIIFDFYPEKGTQKSRKCKKLNPIIELFKNPKAQKC